MIGVTPRCPRVESPGTSPAINDMKHAAPILAVAFALLLPLPALAQDDADKPTSLRPTWQVGQSAGYEFWGRTVKQETATIMGRTQTEATTFVSEGKLAWTVDQVNADGSAACTMRLSSIKFTITAGEQEPMVIDSAKPSGQQPMFDELVAAMVGTPLTVRVNADGTIDAVQGIDEIANAAGQQAREADIVPDELDFIETASELATLLAAPAAATPGQTWNAKNTWNHDAVVPGTDAQAKWDTTFTFDSLGQIAGVPIATIKTESDIDLKVDLSQWPEGAPDIDIDIQNASGAGEILFDLSRSETAARNDKMSYTANITIAPPADGMPPIKVVVKETSQSQLLRVSEE